MIIFLSCSSQNVLTIIEILPFDEYCRTKKDGGGYWNNVYISPWCRVAAYCVGMLLGVLLYKRPKKALKTVSWSKFKICNSSAFISFYKF